MHIELRNVSHEFELETGFLPVLENLSFSVPKKIKNVPPSLQNIYKELKNNYFDFDIPNHGNISKWAKKEKILLLEQLY